MLKSILLTALLAVNDKNSVLYCGTLIVIRTVGDIKNRTIVIRILYVRSTPAAGVRLRWDQKF